MPKTDSKTKTVGWNEINWRKVERYVYKLQKKIYAASRRGDVRKVRKLQKTLMSSWSNKVLSVRKVTQDNRGRKTAGVDGVKSLSPEERFKLVGQLKVTGKSNPTRRVWIAKPGTEEKRPLGIPIIRGWRNYHRFCKMDGARNNLHHIEHRAFKVFNKERKQNRSSSTTLLNKAFPSVPYCENRFIMVKGDKSPYDGDFVYWSERNSKHYDNHTSQALKRQSHSCHACGLKLTSEERVHLHHLDDNHGNWKRDNLLENGLESSDKEIFKLAAGVMLAKRLSRFLRIDKSRAINNSYITYGEYQLFLDEWLKSENHFQSGSAKKPITGISWNKALGFCTWLNSRHQLNTTEEQENQNIFYRLPTKLEAQDYAVREYKELECWTINRSKTGEQGIRVVKAQLPPEYIKLTNYLSAEEWDKARQEIESVMVETMGQVSQESLNGLSIEQISPQTLHTIELLWYQYSKGEQSWFAFDVVRVNKRGQETQRKLNQA